MKYSTVKIAELVKSGQVAIKTGPFGTQLKASEYVEKGTPVLNVKNLGYASVVRAKSDHVGQDTLNRLAIHTLQCGDIVFGRKGAVDRHAFIRAEEDGWMQGSDCIRMRVLTDKLNARYLSYFFLTPKHRSFMVSMCAHGTTMASLNQKILEQIEIPILDRTIQDQIVDILSCIDDKIELNQRINENLERQAEAIFKAWFVDFISFGGIQPISWEFATLNSLTSLISRGIAPKYDDTSDQIILNQKCIRNHLIDLSLARKHQPKVVNEKWLKFGDLLLNSTGEGTLGRAAQVWFAPKNMTVDSHITIVRPKNEALIYYIGLWGISHEREIESLHTGSTGQTELPRERVKSMSLLLPDAETLAKFNLFVAPMAKTIIQNQNENQKLAEMRDALLPKLMFGEIDVSTIQH